MRGLANEEMGATMARTPLADVLQRATAEAAAQERRVSRRDALKLGGAFGLAAAAIPFQAGQAASVYEAPTASAAAAGPCAAPSPTGSWWSAAAS
jgi:hypothetical protein